jgi:hypothetical protein
MPLNNIVSNQIALGGGSVVVSSAGAIAATTASGQNFTVNSALILPTDNRLFFGIYRALEGDGTGTTLQVGEGYGSTWVRSDLTVSGSYAAFGTTPAASGVLRIPHGQFLVSRNSVNTSDINLIGTSSDVITVGQSGLSTNFLGTGNHTFSGPVSVSGTTAGLTTNVTSASDQSVFTVNRSGAGKFAQTLKATTNDTVFEIYNGSWTESFRILNASGYVTVLNRLGVGLSAGTSPSYPLHIVGNAHVQNGGLGVNTAPLVGTILYGLAQTAGNGAARFENNAASATIPVVKIKGGSTPTSTGLLITLTNSSDAEQFGVGPSGQLRTNQFDATATVGAQVNRFPVYDTAGSLVGYVPVYAAS